jgi:hypothetical protein
MVNTSPITGAVAIVKSALRASVIRACDTPGRRGANPSFDD